MSIRIQPRVLFPIPYTQYILAHRYWVLSQYARKKKPFTTRFYFIKNCIRLLALLFLYNPYKNPTDRLVGLAWPGLWPGLFISFPLLLSNSNSKRTVHVYFFRVSEPRGIEMHTYTFITCRYARTDVLLRVFF